MRISLFIAIFLLAAAHLPADQITLKNGDRVSGSIVKKDGDTLTMKSAHFGEITMPWSEIESLQTDSALYVSAGGAEAVPETLAVRGGQAELGGRPVATSEVAVIRNDAEQAAYERMLAPGWLDLWAGNANLGWAGAAGNASTSTFTTGVKADRATRSDKTSLYFNTVSASARIDGADEATAKAVRGGVAYNRNFTERDFVNVFNDYEYDRFQELDLRFVLGGGLGSTLIKSERKRLDLVGGMAYTRENFFTPPVTNSAEAYWGDDSDIKLNSITKLTQGFRMFHNLSDGGDYRVNFDLGSITKLNNHLTWNLNVSNRYFNQPEPGRKTNDLIYSTGLGITFAR